MVFLDWQKYTGYTRRWQIDFYSSRLVTTVMILKDNYCFIFREWQWFETEPENLWILRLVCHRLYKLEFDHNHHQNTKIRNIKSTKTIKIKHLNEAVVPVLEKSCMFSMLLQPMKRIWHLIITMAHSTVVQYHQQTVFCPHSVFTWLAGFLVMDSEISLHTTD